MDRDANLSVVASKTYDVIVIGGGIYGVSVARDAALRGLKVALLEKGDFGHATSANFHKIIHGGLRYLQHGDWKRMRQSIRERSTLLRIAPHLVRPMPFLVPTYCDLWRSRPLMSAALILNDLISADRNRSLPPEKRIGPGKILSRAECLEICPALEHKELTGGALFFDGQASSAGRLTLSILWSAAEAGADVVNYAHVIDFLQDRNTVHGVRAQDMVSGRYFETRANMVVNCSGPWVNKVISSFQTSSPSYTPIRLSKAVVLLTRQIVSGIGLCFSGTRNYYDRAAIVAKGHRYFIITPWRERSLVGTYEIPFAGDPDNLQVTEEEINDFLSQINEAFPAAQLRRQDVYFAYVGLLPDSGTSINVQSLKHFKVLDHEKHLGTPGLISVVGVKFTTARDVAETTVDLLVRKLGRKVAPCQTASTPVHGGLITDVNKVIEEAERSCPSDLSTSSLWHLVQTYGSQYQDILTYCRNDQRLAEPLAPGVSVIKAEVIHGIRSEMAQTLSDIIFRRTELGTSGYPGDLCLDNCARILATELQWTESRIEREKEAVRAEYRRVSCLPQADHVSCVSW